MKTQISVVWILFLLLCACNKNVDSLQRSIPEKEGVSSQGILHFVEAVEQSGDEWHSFVFLRHGKVIAEGWWNPYQSELKQTVYSISKTFTSTAIGFAVSEHLLSVDDKVISFFPDMLPDTVSPYLAQMSVKNLLSMTAGQNPEPIEISKGEDWVKHFLATPVVNEPGTKFLYNSMSSYMLSAIIQKVTGKRTFDYLYPRLFKPLAIKDADWEISPEGINTGGWGLRVHTEDMAKLGQLYLQKGKWNGRQILPESWIEEATTAKIIQKPDITSEEREKDDWAQGYCYQIWRCRYNAFRADGAYGQFIIVMPDQDAVIAIQADLGNMQKEIQLVWDYLLPAIQDKPLPEDKAAEAALKQKLASLAIAPPKGVDSNLQPSLDKETTYLFSDNGKKEATSIRFAGDTCFLNWMGDSLVFGKEQWIAGETRMPAPNLIKNKTSFREFPPFKTYGSYCWTDEQTLSLSLKHIETPHTERLEFSFAGDSIHAKISNSMNYNSYLESGGVKKVQLLDSTIYNDGGYTKYEYDNENRITKISRHDKSGNIILLQTFFYNGNDLVKVILSGDSDSNVGSTMKFSKNGNKIAITTKNNDSDSIQTATIDLSNDGFPTKYEVKNAVGIFEFHDGNLTKYSYKQHAQNGETVEGNFDYKYDNKKSPLYYCKTPRWWWIILENRSVRNNMIEMSNNSGKKVEYNYEFDNAGYPTKCTTKSNDGEFVSEFKYS